MTDPTDGPGILLVPRAAQPRVRWKNDGGWTTELAVRPEGAGEFDWRVSIAEVDADCRFSHFPGIDRSILVLAGPGFDLRVDGEPLAQLRLGDPAHPFSGDRGAACDLVGGPTRDFNVMSRRGRVRHTLTRTRAATLEHRPGLTWLVYVEGGDTLVAGVRATPGDCVILEHVPEDTFPVTLAGDLVLVRLEYL